jgi:hypothetical protein
MMLLHTRRISYILACKLRGFWYGKLLDKNLLEDREKTGRTALMWNVGKF